MLEAIKNHFQVETHHILVVSSFLALQKAANASKMNVIHCDDFVETTIEDKQSCYKCVPNVFEVLNTLLFDKYVEETMYSSILGMNQTMSQYELDETYKNLNQKYADDKDVLDIVDQTYQYHSSQINEHHIKDINPLKTSTTKKFIFDDEENKEDYIEVRKETKKEIIDKIIEKNNEDNIETRKETKEEIIDKIIEKNNEEEHIAHVKQLNKDEENELSELLKQIQKKDKINTPDSDETIKDFKLDLTVEDDSKNVEDNEGKEDSNLFVNIFLELISAILSSFCILFMGIAISVLLMHQWGKDGFIDIIEITYNIYSSIVTTCFSFIFNTLHNYIDFVPAYSNHINENPVFSNQGVHLLNIFIFNTGIIFITKVILVLKERIKNVR